MFAKRIALSELYCCTLKDMVLSLIKFNDFRKSIKLN